MKPNDANDASQTDAPSAIAPRDLFVALAIALASLLLRLSYTNFPLDAHPDEPIIRQLMYRAVHQSGLTANWSGLAGKEFDRATYQFSPYTLTVAGSAVVCNKLWNWPQTDQQFVQYARRFSSGCGAVTVFCVFVASWLICRSRFAAILCELIMATMFVNVQDSAYARVDAYVGMLAAIIICLVLFICKSKRPTFWTFLASLACGIAVAAKYNAIVLIAPLSLAVFAPLQPGSLSSWMSLASRMFIAAIGLLTGALIATPESLIFSSPLIDGANFEFSHYMTGHIPHESFGRSDGNLHYWFVYLSKLGTGYVTLIGLISFIGFCAHRPSWSSAVVLTHCVIGLTAAMIPKVRFERNFEVVTAAVAIAAGLGIAGIVPWIAKQDAKRTGVLSVIAVILCLIQPAKTLYDFKKAIRPESSPFHAAAKQHPGELLTPIWTHESEYNFLLNRRAFLLYGYNDPFSKMGERRWRERMPDWTLVEFQSAWTLKGYPFSTVDYYHGPAKAILALPP